jgi:outer membrane protein assembly factor BamA
LNKKTFHLNPRLAKISLFLVLTTLLFSCDAVKHLNNDQYLLTKNTIKVDSSAVKDAKVYSQLYQKPNPKLFTIPVGLHIYNLAKQQPDSTYQKWLHKKPEREARLIKFLSKKQVDKLGRSYVAFNKWLQKSGNAPVIIDEKKIEKSVKRLKDYYYSFGWFNREVDYTIEKTDRKRASITYTITPKKPYVIDSISEKISSPIVDSLYKMTKSQSFIEPGKQFATNDFINERDRLTLQFRNSGLYYFDQDYVGFDADTVNTGHKVNIDYVIPDRSYTKNDTVYTEPFKAHHITEVRIVTDFSFANRNKSIADSTSFNGYKLFNYEDLKFRPKAITDAIAIIPGEIFKDIDRTLTYNQIGDLRIFKYPNISYQEDPNDTTGTGLITTILLSPRKKYTFDVNFDTYTSTIQQLGVGFSTSFLIRNVFRGAEILEISARGSIGSSKDAADSENTFFNISDVGGDVKLSFPRILFPIKTERWIPKYMSPSTSISIGINVQNNIGLDRQNINASFNYRWKPSKIITNRLDLMNVQYVRNLNSSNYFNVYQNSFSQLNEVAQLNELNNPGSINPDYYSLNTNNELNLIIPEGANNFINDALNGNISGITNSASSFVSIRNIDERKERLTEDNLIFATSFSWTRDTRENLNDKNFSRLRGKIESVGNLLRGVSNISGLEKNDTGNFNILGVTFSQYAKIEGEYIKHWDLDHNNILAFRTFAGIAIPYGNSNSIPFTRSYFAGGANDNRGWQPYDLGPGSSGSVNEFNEANLKIAFNAEYRYTIIGAIKGAFFVDAGNIWNAMDNVDDEASRFTSLSDLRDIAVASGLGLRYDFGFFVIRLDVGFKTYDPSRIKGERWFKDYNFSNAVYNIGINYPF